MAVGITEYAVLVGSIVKSFFKTKTEAQAYAKALRAQGLKRVRVRKDEMAPRPGYQNPATKFPKGKFIKLPAGSKAIKIDPRTGEIVVATGNVTRTRARNTEGFIAGGVFHPIRSGDDYEPDEVGEARAYAPRRVVKKKAKTKDKRRK